MREGGAVVTAKLALLVAAMRAGGARLGVGDLLAAHRALAAVDPSSRADSHLALRAVLCSRHSDLEVFEAGFDAVFGERARGQERERAREEIPEAARLGLPRMAAPSPGQPGDAPPDGTPVPAAWSEVEILREKD